MIIKNPKKPNRFYEITKIDDVLYTLTEVEKAGSGMTVRDAYLTHDIPHVSECVLRLLFKRGIEESIASLDRLAIIVEVIKDMDDDMLTAIEKHGEDAVNLIT